MKIVNSDAVSIVDHNWRLNGFSLHSDQCNDTFFVRTPTAYYTRIFCSHATFVKYDVDSIFKGLGLSEERIMLHIFADESDSILKIPDFSWPYHAILYTYNQTAKFSNKFRSSQPSSAISCSPVQIINDVSLRKQLLEEFESYDLQHIQDHNIELQKYLTQAGSGIFDETETMLIYQKNSVIAWCQFPIVTDALLKQENFLVSVFVNPKTDINDRRICHDLIFRTIEKAGHLPSCAWMFQRNRRSVNHFVNNGFSNTCLIIRKGFEAR